MRVTRFILAVVTATTALITPAATDASHPHRIPTAETIESYLAAYGDAVRFPTSGDCSRVDWLSQDGDGEWFLPVDLDGDGVISCESDMELGA